jgi:xanthine dehydrogenase/oxidase
VAATHEEAVYAARKVVVSYEDLPACISIQAALRDKSFYPDKFEIESGSLVDMEGQSDFVVEGDVNIGGQEHFYLETNCAFVQPIENRQLEITSSTQNATETQMHCASACGLHASHVMSKVKRIGGGFGGKESRAAQFSCPIAIAAHLLQVPVRINVERDTDMSLSGQRHAFYGKYRAGCTKDGKLKFMDLQLYSNAGFSYDLSAPVLGRAMFHCDGPYHWPALRTRGTMCRTNQPSNTAFRGFGGPQGMLMCETVMEHLATKAGVAVQNMREVNLYEEGQHTHYGQPIEAFNVPFAWQQVLAEAKVAERQAAIDTFNKENKWKKRGLCVLPTKYGLNYTAKFMNQVS